MENIRIRGNVQLTKVDKDYPDNKLTGAAFEVYADSNGDKKLDKDDVLIGTLAETETGRLWHDRPFVRRVLCQRNSRSRGLCAG